MLRSILLIAALVVAGIDWLAVAKGWKRVEYLAKPGTMVLLLAYLVSAWTVGINALMFFGLGIFFSLAGDCFLMVSYYRFSDRWFYPGLAAFLLAHAAYIVGFNLPFGNVSLLAGFGIAIVLGLTAARLLRRIIAGIREKGLRRMVAPVLTYGVVITLMLLSAELTLYRADWTAASSGLAGLGAILFFFSDVILAWNKFVRPIKNGRFFNMVAYHLGQIALIAGVVIQFSR